jgi:sugar phosphate isomerase/epimerase
MKLSVITDEISMDFAHALDVMREYGVQGAELRSLWGQNVVDLSGAGVEKAKAILREKRLVVSCIASPVFKCELGGSTSREVGPSHQASERTLADQPALLDRCVELAEVFGTRLVRVFSFWRRGELTPEVEDGIVKQLSRAAEVAGRKGVVLALENEHSCYLGTGEQTARVLQRVNSPHLRAVWDPGNAFCAGENPFPAGYEAIKDYIAHVHVKDAIRLDGGQCAFVAIGDGQIDYPGQLEALKEAGYEGWLSLETHYAPYGGDSEVASRLCLAALNVMLSGVGVQR